MKISIFSFSYEKNDKPPISGGNGIVILTYDLRDLPEPWPEIKENGQSDAVKNFFYIDNKFVINLLNEHEERALGNLIDGAIKIGIIELRIFYGCKGGYQRSVFWSEDIFRWVKENFQDQEVILEHLSPRMRE